LYLFYFFNLGQPFNGLTYGTCAFQQARVSDCLIASGLNRILTDTYCSPATKPVAKYSCNVGPLICPIGLLDNGSYQQLIILFNSFKSSKC
jgi:hypothetical protein